MLADIIIPIITGFGGSLIGIKYSETSKRKEYKSLLILLIQEFTLLLDRSTMYYGQFVNRSVSFSSLFQISDNNSFLRLAQVADNEDTIEAALKLKADFFQVHRHVQRASEHMSKQAEELAKGHFPKANEELSRAMQASGMAMNFFIGDQIIEKKFHRKGYDRYISNIQVLINELKSINDKRVLPFFDSRKQLVDKFVKKKTAKLKEIDEKIRLQRKKEKLLLDKALKVPAAHQ